MSVVHEDLAAVASAVEIMSSAQYSVLGDVRTVADGQSDESAKADDMRLASRLAVDLYERLYIRPTTAFRPWQEDVIVQRDFLAALCAANTGHGNWDTGWSVRDIDEFGQIIVAKNDVSFRTSPTRVRTEKDSMQPGERCWARVENELPLLRSGLLCCNRRRRRDDRRQSRKLDLDVRYYWHLNQRRRAAFHCNGHINLERGGSSLSGKVLRDPSMYSRADAGVLYLSRRNISRATATDREDPHSRRTRASPAGAPFHEESGRRPGCVRASDRRTEFRRASMPARRPGTLARVYAWRGSHEARIASIASIFIQEHLDPLRPHLGQVRGDDYTKLCPSAGGPAASLPVTLRWRNPQHVPFSGSTQVSPVEAAVRIGETLCQLAYWDNEGRVCNWVGRSRNEVNDFDGPITATVKALGCELYDGSAGIALYLAQLYALTGQSRSYSLPGSDQAIARRRRSFAG